jgi:glycosyltransferase involved in cell wall biosynthesis
MRLSVLIPAYRASRTLISTICSATKILPAESEVLVYLDGKDVESYNQLMRLNDSRVRVIHSAENRGETFSRNFLLNEARGEYVANLDADDLCINNRFQVQLQEVERNPNAIIFTNVIFWYENSSFIKYLPSFPFELLAKNARISLGLYNPFVNSTMLARKEILNSIGEFREHAPDYDFWMRAAIKEIELIRIREYGVKYRIHGSQLSKNQDWKQEILNSKILSETVKNLRDRLELDSVDSDHQVKKIEKLLKSSSKQAYLEYLSYSRGKPAIKI